MNKTLKKYLIIGAIGFLLVIIFLLCGIILNDKETVKIEIASGGYLECYLEQTDFSSGKPYVKNASPPIFYEQAGTQKISTSFSFEDTAFAFYAYPKTGTQPLSIRSITFPVDYIRYYKIPAEEQVSVYHLNQDGQNGTTDLKNGVAFKLYPIQGKSMWKYTHIRWGYLQGQLLISIFESIGCFLLYLLYMFYLTRIFTREKLQKTLTWSSLVGGSILILQCTTTHSTSQTNFFVAFSAFGIVFLALLFWDRLKKKFHISQYTTQKRRLRFRNLLLGSALFFTILISGSYFLGFTGFLVGLSIQIWYLPLAAVLTCAGTYLYVKRCGESTRSVIILICVCLFLSVFACWFSSKVYDITMDGTSYHQLSTYSMTNGWNPTRETADEFFQRTKLTLYSPVWIQTTQYTKSSETVSASIYKQTGDIQSGKGVNWWFIFLLFSYSCYFFAGQRRNIAAAIFFSCMVTLNPHVISESITYMIDGNLYAAFTILLFSVLLLWEDENRKIYFFFAICAAAFLFNTKLTGVAYTGLIFGISFVLSLIRKRWGLVRKLIGTGVILFILFVMSAFNPYITNLMHGKHLLHPIYGAEKIAIFGPPHQFIEDYFSDGVRYQVESFQASNLGGHGMAPVFGVPQIHFYFKYPFTIKRAVSSGVEVCGTASKDEIGMCSFWMTSFGPMWSGLFIIGIIFALQNIRLPAKPRFDFFMMIAIIWIAALINPAACNLRFVTHFWLFPILSLAYFSLYPTRHLIEICPCCGVKSVRRCGEKTLWQRGIAVFGIVAIIFYNFLPSTYCCLRAANDYTMEMNKIMQDFCNPKMKSAILAEGIVAGNVYSFLDKGAKFDMVRSYGEWLKFENENKSKNLNLYRPVIACYYRQEYRSIPIPSESVAECGEAAGR